MTLEQGLSLIQEKEGALCARLTRRYDGTFLTADCPVGLAARMRKIRRRFVYTLMTAALVVFAFWGFARSRSESEASITNQDQEALTEKIDEWIDQVRIWVGLPPKHIK